MRSTLFAIAIASAMTPATLSAQIQFEGRVTGTMMADGMEVQLVQRMKGSMMRVDMTLSEQNMEVSQLFDARSGSMVMIAHDQKMWMDVAMLSRMMPGAASQVAAARSTELPDFRRTDRVETIAGYECRHYILSLEGGHEVDVCAAPDLGCFVPGAPAGLEGGGAAIPGLPQRAEVWIEEFENGFFILSMTTEDASYVASEVEPGQPPDEIFTPPADYTEMTMPLR